MSQDTYTATQAGQVLGLSTKRVRQLVAEKKLKAIPRSKPLLIEAESVHKERKRRGETSTMKPALNAGSLVEVLLQIEQARQAGYEQALEHSQRQITAVEASEAHTKEELYKAQAERKALYEELLEARVRLATLEAQADKKGFFRR